MLQCAATPTITPTTHAATEPHTAVTPLRPSSGEYSAVSPISAHSPFTRSIASRTTDAAASSCRIEVSANCSRERPWVRFATFPLPDWNERARGLATPVRGCAASPVPAVGLAGCNCRFYRKSLSVSAPQPVQIGDPGGRREQIQGRQETATRISGWPKSPSALSRWSPENRALSGRVRPRPTVSVTTCPR